jgi:hypothetical protein
MAAVAANASTDAITPENTRFIKASRSACRIACGLDFCCRNHAVSGAQRQAARRTRHCRVFR